MEQNSTPVKNKGGRPKLIIDYERVAELAEIQCTQEAIALDLGISVRTLQRNPEFCRVYGAAQEKGKTLILRKQFELAKKGDRQILIWLGKQYLGQTEKTDASVSGLGGLVWQDEYGVNVKKDEKASNKVVQIA